MTAATAWLDRKIYPDHSDNWDNRLFRRRVLKHLEPSTDLLDLGAGAGIVEAMDFRAHVRTARGVDLDRRVLENPFLHEAKVSSADELPWAEKTFDVVVANNVLEHLEEPTAVFREVRRVLKPGGVFLSKTPSSFHYVALIARCTPHRFHEWVNAKRGRSERDTFPTLYRANTARRIRSHCRSAGLAVAEVERVEGRPEYLRFSLPTYLAGIGYERLVNSTELLSALRAVLIAVVERPSGA